LDLQDNINIDNPESVLEVVSAIIALLLWELPLCEALQTVPLVLGEGVSSSTLKHKS
jgi:hypothetical protein